MKKYIFVLWYFVGIISYSGLSQQNLVTLNTFKPIEAGDTLNIRYENIGCRVKYTYQYLIWKQGQAFELIYYEVPNKLMVDGKEILDFKKKEKIISGDVLTVTKRIDLDTLNNILADLEKIINSNNDIATKIAGDFSILKIKLRTEIFEKRFDGWIKLRKY